MATSTLRHIQIPVQSRHVFSYDLGVGNEKQLSAFRLVSKSSLNWPTNWKYQVSDDGVTWTNILTHSGGTADATYSVKMDKTYRYHSLYVSSCNYGDNSYIIQQIFGYGKKAATPVDKNYSLTVPIAGLTAGDINSIAATADTAGGDIWFAMSFGTEYRVRAGSDWQVVVRKNGDIWQYRNGSEVWENASVNTAQTALSEAMSVAANRMDAIKLTGCPSPFTRPRPRLFRIRMRCLLM